MLIGVDTVLAYDASKIKDILGVTESTGGNRTADCAGRLDARTIWLYDGTGAEDGSACQEVSEGSEKDSPTSLQTGRARSSSLRKAGRVGVRRPGSGFWRRC